MKMTEDKFQEFAHNLYDSIIDEIECHWEENTGTTLERLTISRDDFMRFVFSTLPAIDIIGEDGAKGRSK